jgi:uncharacterized protein (DUF2345 family)
MHIHIIAQKFIKSWIVPLLILITTFGGMASASGLTADRKVARLAGRSPDDQFAVSGSRNRPDSTNQLMGGDDDGTSYPLVIDPFIQQAKLTASDGSANDVFGHSVAISGDTLVVGAPYDDLLRGSAYVFVKSATRGATWIETAKLTASGGVAGDQFGYSVAIRGDTVVIGANGNDKFRGSAYVFVKPEAGWSSGTETAKLTASDGASPHYFGNSVAISGDTVVVGAQYGDSFRGSAYVFVKPGRGWTSGTETAKLTASDGVALDSFGIHVTISGDTVVVGSWRDSRRGSAYLFVKPEAGWATKSETAKLIASDGAAGAQFGFSVAMSGDTVAVGSWRDSRRGAVYLFVKPEAGWATKSETAKLTASDGVVFNQFGISIAINGDTVVVGAWNDNLSRGSTYLFVKPGMGWASGTESAKITASDRVASDNHFGTSVDIDGDTVVVGAYGNNSMQGAAYVFGKRSQQ